MQFFWEPSSHVEESVEMGIFAPVSIANSFLSVTV